MDFILEKIKLKYSSLFKEFIFILIFILRIKKSKKYILFFTFINNFIFKIVKNEYIFILTKEKKV